jgi:hypothetical protein
MHQGTLTRKLSSTTQDSISQINQFVVRKLKMTKLAPAAQLHLVQATDDNKKCCLNARIELILPVVIIQTKSSVFFEDSRIVGLLLFARIDSSDTSSGKMWTFAVL